MIFSINTEKAFDEIRHPFMINKTTKTHHTRMGKKLPQLDKKHLPENPQQTF